MQKSPTHHKLRILSNASNSPEGITPHYGVDGQIEKLWRLTQVYTSETERRSQGRIRRFHFITKMCPPHHTLRGCVTGKQHGHSRALPDLSTEHMR